METTPFIERDISWLSFNFRVLQEAMDKSVPLYERIKFLAIYSSNLDEFFRVRVASLRSLRKLDKSTKKELDLKPRLLLKNIRRIVSGQQNIFGRVFKEEILPELARHKIFLVNETQLSAGQIEFARQFFHEKIAPLIKPRIIQPNELPFLEDKSLYFIVSFQTPDEQVALVTLPVGELGRFVLLPSSNHGHFVAFLDDLVRLGLPSLFPDRILTGVYAVKVSRDAELYIDDEYSGDLLNKIKLGLNERHIGLPSRFLYDDAMPVYVLEKVMGLFDLNKNDLIPGARYHNFNDFFAFPDPAGLQELHDEEQPPLPHPLLEPCLAKGGSMMEKMKGRDFLLHFPYQKFDYVVRLIEEAAADPRVENIKITLYRVASRSSVCEALLKALANGKSVSAFIEAKARFDEESNLIWGEKLEKAGALVRYSYPGIKVHTKLLLITTKTGERYGYLATGNFNEKTARLYADHAILTTDTRLTQEVSQVFDLLDGKVILPRCKNIFVAPFSMRQGFEKLVDKEIENAKRGKEAWMIIKFNSLEDQPMAGKLIEASQAGVKIKLICRGICILVPALPGLTENIEITSILDRYLEHARVYIFANGGQPKMYLASADWMNRNLDRRVEVAFPVYDKNLQDEIRKIIEFQLADNVKARNVDGRLGNKYKKGPPRSLPLRAQVETYEYLKSLA